MEQEEQQAKRRSQRDYTLGFKLAVVDEVEKGELTYKRAQIKYGIQGRSTVLVWLRKLGTLDWSKPKVHFVSTPKQKTPDQRIKELEAALQQERDKNLLLNTIVAIAEKQYGINIRKKSSPRQQSNSSKQEN
ncbi:transposase [Bacteroidota bacterium]|nr:transposase [Bacteroidota bacterium]